MNNLVRSRSWIFLALVLGLLSSLSLGCIFPLGTDAPVPSATPPGGGGDAPTPTAALPTAPPIPACDLHQLLGQATWQGATGALAGVIRLGNPLADCRLTGNEQLLITAKDGQTLKVQFTVQPGDLMIPSQRTAEASFVWRNYCGPAPVSGGLTLNLAIPDPTNQVPIPVLDANNAPLNDTPRCDSRADPSTFQLEAFQVR